MTAFKSFFFAAAAGLPLIAVPAMAQTLSPETGGSAAKTSTMYSQSTTAAPSNLSPSTSAMPGARSPGTSGEVNTTGSTAKAAAAGEGGGGAAGGGK